jgi:hypothetical protein
MLMEVQLIEDNIYSKCNTYTNLTYLRSLEYGGALSNCVCGKKNWVSISRAGGWTAQDTTCSAWRICVYPGTL